MSDQLILLEYNAMNQQTDRSVYPTSQTTPTDQYDQLNQLNQLNQPTSQTMQPDQYDRPADVIRCDQYTRYMAHNTEQLYQSNHSTQSNRVPPSITDPNFKASTKPLPSITDPNFKASTKPLPVDFIYWYAYINQIPGVVAIKKLRELTNNQFTLHKLFDEYQINTSPYISLCDVYCTDCPRVEKNRWTAPICSVCYAFKARNLVYKKSVYSLEKPQLLRSTVEDDRSLIKDILYTELHKEPIEETKYLASVVVDEQATVPTDGPTEPIIDDKPTGITTHKPAETAAMHKTIDASTMKGSSLHLVGDEQLAVDLSADHFDFDMVEIVRNRHNTITDSIYANHVIGSLQTNDTTEQASHGVQWGFTGDQFADDYDHSNRRDFQIEELD